MRPRAARKSLQDQQGHPLLTRTEAARLANVTTTSVRRWEQNGRLSPVVIDRIHYFTHANVLEAVQSREVSCSAAAFGLFDEGQSAVEVTRALDEDPVEIGRLFDAYQQLSGNIVVKGPRSMRAWMAEYGLQPEQLTPGVLLRCIEIVCADPKLKALLDLPPAQRR